MPAAKLVLIGGNGFLGRHVRQHFEHLGYQVVSISRTGPGDVRWDARTLGPWVAELEGADLLVNLAGRSVDCRYTAANRQAVLASRVESTAVLAAAVTACQRPPRVWLNSSTATIYADTRGSLPANTEAAGTIGEGFSVEVAQAWEAAFMARATPATRRVALRTAIVLGADGGAFPVMARLARWGLCSPQGDGEQWVSWLHITDFCRTVEFLAKADDLSGPVNLCAPNPLRNGEFNALLTQALDPPLRFPQPRLLLKAGAWLLRTETELILKSRKVYPAQLLAAGFQFEYPTCKQAMWELLGIGEKTPEARAREAKQANAWQTFIRVLGILLSLLGGLLVAVPYVGIIFLPVAFVSNILILASTLSRQYKVLLVAFPYVFPAACYSILLL